MRVVLFMVMLALIGTMAYAFEPEPGARAYPIVGRDLVSGETISLEEHRGEWVLLCFWTSW